ncbi:hypothetical protein QBC44DRAFT_330040 [Cladorrhinum sp. PSN332]|nr:hypothetical protein QBC44DRAFT_330040 [Cladorrhinum sp. PSN332]
MSDAIFIQTLTESFIALADEVQSLIDRKTILEHKLRYAHEQYQYLADKYAPAVPEVSETLAKLQIPPDLHPLVSATTAVPLPIRSQTGSSQHQLALLIREGRKAAQKLAVDLDLSVSPAMEVLTTTSTVLEKDFTVEGKKGVLACPFSATPKQPNQDGGGQGEPRSSGSGGGAGRVDNPQDPAGNATAAAVVALTDDPTPHKSSDPICAAMVEDVVSATPAAASKCPIRYLDKHSPEEIAHYVETHKHEIPRSHEVCVRRYQKNEEQIRKLDAKYGNLVSMVEDLSHLHRPMLPADAGDPAPQADATSSNKRVEDWAQTIVAGDPEPNNDDDLPLLAGEGEGEGEEEDRQGRFDRAFREVRVGESPSRPWGISVPAPKPGFRSDDKITDSSPVPPLNPRLTAQMTTHIVPPRAAATEKTESKKCPFDHTKMGAAFQGMLRPQPTTAANGAAGGRPRHGNADGGFDRPSSPLKNDAGMPSSPPQATFVNLSDHMPPTAAAGQKDDRPQIVFNISGPVFIGYPMEQAMQFMQQFQQGR